MTKNKPMKPCKAWALVNRQTGEITNWSSDQLDIFVTRAYTDTVDSPIQERIVRILVVENAAADKAIAMLKDALEHIDSDSPVVSAYEDAILGLGGKP